MSRNLIEKYDCRKGNFALTSAWGGDQRVIQITTMTGYCVVTFEEGYKLFRKCLRAMRKLEKEYDANPPWWEQMAKKTDNTIQKFRGMKK